MYIDHASIKPIDSSNPYFISFWWIYYKTTNDIIDMLNIFLHMAMKWSVLELRWTTPWLHTILVFYWSCQEKWINEEFRLRLQLRCHMWKTEESCKIAMKNCYKTGLHDSTIRRRITISNVIKWFYGFKSHLLWNQVEW